MSKLGGFLARFWREEDAAAAAEYALLLAIIAAGLAVSAGVLGTAISNAMNNTSECINDSSTC
jgi:pilus assembly protein Flp/PilA